WKADYSQYWRLDTGWAFQYWEEQRLPIAGWIDVTSEKAGLHGLNPMAGVLSWHEGAALKSGVDGLIFEFRGFADVNGDGRRDLVVSRREEFNNAEDPFAGFFVHLNTTAGSPLVADINRDGFVNAQDLGLLIAAWTG
ncbi:hypothetical protein OAR33_00590, partial [bacterium]|nr:hypothetical protein [bacterium]